MQQEGLRFWEVKARDKKEVLFKSGELLLNTANEYFNYCTDNPIKPSSVTGGALFKPRVSPFSLLGVCLYLGCGTNYFSNMKVDLIEREDKLTEAEAEVLDAMNRIEEVIHLYKYNYAATGILNTRIMLRDLELSEKRTVVKRIIRVREG